MKRALFLGGGLAVAGLAVTRRTAAASQADAHLRRIVRDFPGTVGIYARAMDGRPPRFEFNAGEQFAAASTIKLVIMLASYREFERDPSLMRTTVALRASDIVGGSDFLQYATAGARYALATLVKYMIIVSDNTAANSLITYLGFDTINAVAEQAGLRDTHLGRHFADYVPSWQRMHNVTTPRDMGELCYLLEKGARESYTTVARPQTCNAMIKVMLGQEDHEKIAAGLPRGVPIANKTGEINGVRNDVAIVAPFGDTPYVLSVFSRDIDDYASAARGIRRISSVVYGELGA